MMKKFLYWLPLIAAVLVAVLWGSIYFFLGELSGMWAMFDRRFPFFIAWLAGVHPGNMTTPEGIFFALLDGGLFGLTIGFLLRLLFSNE